MLVTKEGGNQETGARAMHATVHLSWPVRVDVIWGEGRSSQLPPAARARGTGGAFWSCGPPLKHPSAQIENEIQLFKLSTNNNGCNCLMQLVVYSKTYF